MKSEQSSRAGEARRSFRVKFVEPVPGRLQPADTRCPVVPGVAPILDLSMGGAKLRLELTPPIGKRVAVELSFELEGIRFDNLQGELVWSNNDGGEHACGISFTDLPRPAEQRLFRALNSYQMKRARRPEEARRPSPMHYWHKAAQVLELLPYPALLVSDRRDVLEANGPARAAGIVPRGQCYRAGYGRDSACPHCRLEEALDRETVIKAETVVNGERHEYSWLHLESGYLVCGCRKTAAD